MELFKPKPAAWLATFFLYYFINYCDSFIIPNELPSLLSIIYSNIPPVKLVNSRMSQSVRSAACAAIRPGPVVRNEITNQYAGPFLCFDTRFGLGFRLGPHADFQTLVEIGPQTNTNPISSNGTVSKRQSNTLRGLHRLRELTKNAEVKPSVKNSPQKGLAKGKKADKTVVGKIEFKKIPGIDDVNEKTKSLKTEKLSSGSSPTKFVLL